MGTIKFRMTSYKIVQKGEVEPGKYSYRKTIEKKRYPNPGKCYMPAGSGIFFIFRIMTAKLRIHQIMISINRLLTRVNLSLAIFVFSAGLPKNYENMRIPPILNIVLLLVLIVILFMYITGFSNTGPQPSNLA